jgi:hypothetical protein
MSELKRMFCPFSEIVAGDPHVLLANQLRNTDQNKKGFTPDEYVYAAEKKKVPVNSTNPYEFTTKLQMLIDSDDYLYICGHCNTGLDYLASDEACQSNNRVTVPDLVNQLEAHRFSQRSFARVKIWVCKGGLGLEGTPSFAARFSTEMFNRGWRHCRIFAYTASVFAEYMKGSGEEYTKQVHLEGEAKERAEDVDNDTLKKFIKEKLQPKNLKELQQVKADDEVRDAQLWINLRTMFTKASKKRPEEACQYILGIAQFRRDLVKYYKRLHPHPIETRARHYRLEFKEGRVVARDQA